MPLTTRTVTYADQGTPLTGELYWDTGGGPRPGILLIHGGGGRDAHARGQASRYAALGYVVFACDMLGDGVAGDRERVIGAVTAMRDDAGLLAGRARAGLAQLAGCGLASESFAAVGFCFGGLAALAASRSRARQSPAQCAPHPPQRPSRSPPSSRAGARGRRHAVTAALLHCPTGP